MTAYNVSGSAQLTAALGKAVAGDTITLAGGNYGAYYISGKQFAGQVVVTAGQPGTVHFDSLNVDKSSNITFSGLDVGRALKSGEGFWTSMTSVLNSTNIHLNNLNVHGAIDGTLANDGRGLLIDGSSGIQVTGTKFHDLVQGVVEQRSSSLSVLNNSFTNLQIDGIDSSAVKNVMISGNTFQSFHPVSGDHPDAIQFFNTNMNAGSSGITISNNIVMQGDGVGTQGIFISDAGPYGYSNVNIFNNLVYSNDQYNGIFVAGAKGVQITGNSVLSQSTDNKFQKIYVDTSSNVLVKNNVAEQIFLDKTVTGLTASHNLDLGQTPSLRSLFGNLNHPSGPQDLVISDYGYHASSSSVIAPPPPAPLPTASIAPTSTTASPMLLSGGMVSATSASTGSTSMTNNVESHASATLAPSSAVEPTPTNALPTDGSYFTHIFMDHFLVH